MISEEYTRRLSVVKQAAQDFMQIVNLADGSLDSKLSEIKALELKAERLKDEVKNNQDRANAVIQQATEAAAKITNQANLLLQEATIAKSQARDDKESADRTLSEARALMGQAMERQKTADLEWHKLDARTKKLEEALR